MGLSSSSVLITLQYTRPSSKGHLGSSYYHGQLWDSTQVSNHEGKIHTPNWGTLQQPIMTEHQQRGVQSGASSRSCWRITQLFFSSPPYLSLCRWSIPTACENVCIATVLLSPPLVILVREKNCGWLLEETLWRPLFIGERDTVTFASGAYERQKDWEGMRETHDGYSKLFE